MGLCLSAPPPPQPSPSRGEGDFVGNAVRLTLCPPRSRNIFGRTSPMRSGRCGGSCGTGNWPGSGFHGRRRSDVMSSISFARRKNWLSKSMVASTPRRPTRMNAERGGWSRADIGSSGSGTMRCFRTSRVLLMSFFGNLPAMKNESEPVAASLPLTLTLPLKGGGDGRFEVWSFFSLPPGGGGPGWGGSGDEHD